MADIFKLRPHKPRKLRETVYSDRGLQLPRLIKAKPGRWAWMMLIVSPFVGILIAAVWHWFTR